MGTSNSKGFGLETGAAAWHARRDSNPQPADPKSSAGEPDRAPHEGRHEGAAPEDARFAALRATWERLDDVGRETLLRVAEGLARK